MKNANLSIEAQNLMEEIALESRAISILAGCSHLRSLKNFPAEEAHLDSLQEQAADMQAELISRLAVIDIELPLVKEEVSAHLAKSRSLLAKEMWLRQAENDGCRGYLYAEEKAEIAHLEKQRWYNTEMGDKAYSQKKALEEERAEIAAALNILRGGASPSPADLLSAFLSAYASPILATLCQQAHSAAVSELRDCVRNMNGVHLYNVLESVPDFLSEKWSALCVWLDSKVDCGDMADVRRELETLCEQEGFCHV